MNMSFGKAAGSNSKKSSWKHFPKRFNIYVIMVSFNCLFVLCCFYLCYVPLFYYFPRHSQRKRSK